MTRDQVLRVDIVTGNIVVVTPGGRYEIGPPDRGHERHMPVSVGDTLRVISGSVPGDLHVEIRRCGCQTFLVPREPSD